MLILKILMLAYYCYLNNIFKEHFISQPNKVHQWKFMLTSSYYAIDCIDLVF